jgi:hypothetical protein
MNEERLRKAEATVAEQNRLIDLPRGENERLRTAA